MPPFGAVSGISPRCRIGRRTRVRRSTIRLSETQPSTSPVTNPLPIFWRTCLPHSVLISAPCGLRLAPPRQAPRAHLLSFLYSCFGPAHSAARPSPRCTLSGQWGAAVALRRRLCTSAVLFSELATRPCWQSVRPGACPTQRACLQASRPLARSPCRGAALCTPSCPHVAYVHTLAILVAGAAAALPPRSGSILPSARTSPCL